MNKAVVKARMRRKKRVRAQIIGKNTMPRLSMFRSSKYIYAQVINDEEAKTIVSHHDVKMTGGKKMKKVDRAKVIGLELGKMLIEAKITQVVFDRGAYAYKGRVKAVAEGVREAGVRI